MTTRRRASRDVACAGWVLAWVCATATGCGSDGPAVPEDAEAGRDAGSFIEHGDAGRQDAGSTMDASLAADAHVAPSDDAGHASDAAHHDAAALDDAGTAAPLDASRAPGPHAVAEPPPVTFPSVVGTLSVTLLTSTASGAGTDDEIELCLDATHCVLLDTPEINDREPGSTEVHHIERFGLPRASVDRVMLRTRNPAATSNDWRPACMDIRFDGEPVYCNDAIDAVLAATGAPGTAPSYVDSAGLHRACVSCAGTMLTHGPMVGEPSPTSVRVWVRADASRRVALRLGETEDLSFAPIVAWADPRPEDDFTATLVAEELAPATTYHYRVELDGVAAGPVRAVRTAPLPSSREPVRIAFGSCARWDAQPIFSLIAAASPDLMLFLGDAHYGDASHLDASRWHYRRVHAMPERRAMMSTLPTLATWDDHDFVGNDSDGQCFGIADSTRAFEEYWSHESYGTAEIPGVFFAHRQGPVELFMLDCRTYRAPTGLPRGCATDPARPTLPLSDGILGPRQTAWLLDALTRSDATFKLLACGSQFTAHGDSDSWAMYPEARAALLAAFEARHVGGIVLLSGDIHRHTVRRIPGAGTWAIPELTSSGLANETRACESDSEESYCLSDQGFMTLDVDARPADPVLVVQVHDELGRVRFEGTIRRSELGP